VLAQDHCDEFVVSNFRWSGGGDSGSSKRDQKGRGISRTPAGADLARSPLITALLFWLWLVVVACAWDFGVFHLPVAGWGMVGLQVLGYGVDVAPIIVLAPRTLRCLALPRRQALAGGVLVGGAVLYLVATQHPTSTDLAETMVGYAATGLGEELAFRGYLWARLRSAGLRGAVLVVVDVAAFVLWHLPSVVSGLSGISALIGIAVFGVIFALARLWSGNAGLPVLLHIAADVAGV
jgi:membrane protease YdiL (CAAX protease family)